MEAAREMRIVVHVYRSLELVPRRSVITEHLGTRVHV